MDWRHVLFAAEEGLIGIVALAATLPAFALFATANRKVWACSSSLTCLSGFLISCLLAGTPGIEASQLAGAVPLATLAATVLLVAPSIFALRWRWLGILHLLTVTAALYLWLVGTLAISHDAT